jgi:hypothetical protein
LPINYEHHPVESPYRIRFAIFVREGDQTYDKVNEVPQQLRNRILAVRPFDVSAMMVDNRLVGRNELEPLLEKKLAPLKNARAFKCRLHAYPLCGSWLLCRKSATSLALGC